MNETEGDIIKEPKIVRIDWHDVMSLDTALIFPEDLDNVKPAIASIIGFLVKETKEAYFIAKEYWGSGQFKYVHVLPKKTAILKITTLKAVK